MKRLWTTNTAAVELGISRRHLLRYLKYLGITPVREKNNRGNGFHILGPVDMIRLRAAIDDCALREMRTKRPDIMRPVEQ